MPRKSFASIIIFIGSLLCFSLPFITISCGATQTFTGKDLVGGTVIDHKQVGGDPFAALAATAALVGFGLSLWGRSMAKANTGAGAVGVGSLLLMKANIENQVHQQVGGMATVTTENGFNLAVVLLAAGAIWNGIMVVTNEDF